jgi:hypothetical protein
VAVVTGWLAVVISFPFLGASFLFLDDFRPVGGASCAAVGDFGLFVAGFELFVAGFGLIVAGFGLVGTGF